jgi:hypothetical protein
VSESGRQVRIKATVARRFLCLAVPAPANGERPSLPLHLPRFTVSMGRNFDNTRAECALAERPAISRRAVWCSPPPPPSAAAAAAAAAEAEAEQVSSADTVSRHRRRGRARAGGAGALPTRASKVRRGLRCSHDFARLGRPPPSLPPSRMTGL